MRQLNCSNLVASKTYFETHRLIFHLPWLHSNYSSLDHIHPEDTTLLFNYSSETEVYLIGNIEIRIQRCCPTLAIGNIIYRRDSNIN